MSRTARRPPPAISPPKNGETRRYFWTAWKFHGAREGRGPASHDKGVVKKAIVRLCDGLKTRAETPGDDVDREASYMRSVEPRMTKTSCIAVSLLETQLM